MVKLNGRSYTRREIAERAGMLSQFAGVRLMELSDGVERGIRMLEFRTGSGLRFTALIDRALDIADCEFKGQAIGWNSPAGFRHPGLHEYEGEGGLAWARSFSGLLVTCGLDHILFMNEVSAETYVYSPKKTVSHSLHGRVGTIPAKLTGYGEEWRGDECVLWAEGIVQQSAVFGEDLQLIRRIEADVGGKEIRITDRVVNHGFYRTPHMALVLPIFLELSAVKLIGNPLAAILPFSFFPFGVYLTYIYFSTAVSRDLLDAARIDGANEFQVFMKIAMPLATPVIALVGFFNFTGNWNNYFLPYVTLPGKKAPIQVGLAELLSNVPAFNPTNAASTTISLSALALATLLAIAPVLIVFLFAQRYLVSGMTAGGTKE